MLELDKEHELPIVVLHLLEQNHMHQGLERLPQQHCVALQVGGQQLPSLDGEGVEGGGEEWRSEASFCCPLAFSLLHTCAHCRTRLRPAVLRSLGGVAPPTVLVVERQHVLDAGGAFAGHGLRE